LRVKRRTETSSTAATDTIVRDYRIAFVSREASYLGRKEVFSGKAKFGIFGDGKEVAQVAMAHAFRKGDVRSGYYRDQTIMLALGMLSLEEFFAQLYAHADVEHEPASGGRSMTAHFATRTLNPDGSWKALAEMLNSSADVSPTGSQMPRLVGLGYASRLYRELEGLRSFTRFSKNGDEIAFGTVGNATCAEGLFWESVNAIGVLQVPVVVSIWDDEYGISVHNEHQITKGDLSELLGGFQRAKGSRKGFDVHRVKGWDYPALCETYRDAADTARREHVPSLIHVTEMTQPQGHSTSGSHERYKSQERLEWEADHDCVRMMRDWLLEQGVVDEREVQRMEQEDRQHVRDSAARAWAAYSGPIRKERDALMVMIEDASRDSSAAVGLDRICERLRRMQNPLRRDVMRALHDALVATRRDPPAVRERLRAWDREQREVNQRRYSSHLYSESAESALNVTVVPPAYDDDPRDLRGFEILNRCFDAALARYPQLVALGEDVGRLGDVNQGFAGLQKKYGELRVSDTGIREATIVGQGIGMAMRGLRPIVELQYLDYVLYALQIMSDDLATVRYRSAGGQKAPLIIRTRGHRLEGIWHAGSPMAGIINLVRGMYVCVPRDMTRAAGFYNTLLRSDDPALIVEVLNGYRLREKLPSNIGEFTVPLGVPDVLRAGSDVTVVTYGACCRIAMEAAEQLSGVGIEVELLDVQTLLPFDRPGKIVESVKRTGRVVFLDEDVPGGATAFMLQQVLDQQGGYAWLDSPPRAVSARPHRPAYGSDGDYWSKPNREDVFRAVYDLMHETDPTRFPSFY
jgi:pyruvate/2-oxoglutarate/acetoin dehydrogenase E1 component/TPP-dependent pyruvate/acetoin dehydrogenase alpha subunit